MKHLLENVNYVEEISLDNNLGEFEREWREVLDWLEERLIRHTILPPEKIHIHTGNPYYGKSKR